MLPVKDLRLALGELLAADVATLAPAAANKIALVINPFVPDETLTFGDFTLATFTGSTPKAGAAGAQQAGIDPNTGEQKITILAPAGGWRWECTAAPAAPEIVYGFILMDNAGAVLLGMESFVNGIPVANIGDFIDLGAAEISFVAQPMQ